jgi:hypothetical protein
MLREGIDLDVGPEMWWSLGGNPGGEEYDGIATAAVEMVVGEVV